MTEHSCIFFISRRIWRDFTKFKSISRIWRIIEYNAIFTFKIFFNAVKCFLCLAIFLTYSSHYTEAVRFNKDFTFITFIGTNLITVSIISSYEPFTIISVLQYRFSHFFNLIWNIFIHFIIAECLVKPCKFSSDIHKHSCDKHRLCYFAVIISRNLKRFIGDFRKAVQI